jgi:transposase
MRTRTMNQLQAVAMNEGYRWKKKLFSAQGRALLEKLSLAPWASRRRKELLELLDQLDPKIVELTAAVEHEAKKRPEVVRLMTHPGVGPITGLAYVLVIGTPERFHVASVRARHAMLPSSVATSGIHFRCSPLTRSPSLTMATGMLELTPTAQERASVRRAFSHRPDCNKIAASGPISLETS